MDDMKEFNQRELALIAQDVNPNAHAGLRRDVLYDVACGEEIDLPERKLDRYRLRVMEFVNEYWEQVRPLLSTCPARTRNPRACFQCTDLQSMECVLVNKDNLSGVE